jgi:phosphopantothenoylcysteine synthetase/decarboxylase
MPDAPGEPRGVCGAVIAHRVSCISNPEMSNEKNIVLGVTGSIAAHRAVDLASLLTKQKCNVRVVMTADALRFIAPLPFKVLTRHPVVTNLFDEEGGWKPTHLELVDEADLLLIAPATANVIAKLAHGLADNALTCLALALNPRAKVLIAPAMNGKMWLHPATQQNVATLKARGVEFIGPEEGMLSCGYEGVGRLWPVADIAQRALKLVTPSRRSAGGHRT